MSQTQPSPAVSHVARERTYYWGDPAPTPAALLELGGLEALLAMAEGSLPLPPALATLGLVPVSAEMGRAVFSLTPQEWHQNPLGTLHGGILTGLLDTATGCAVHSTLARGTLYTTVDLSVTFLRPAPTTRGEVRCEGHVVSRGSRTAFAQAEVRDDRDRLVAHATSTCLLLTGDEH